MESKLNNRFQQPLKQWIKAIVWSLVYILFIVWVGNYWWMLLLPVVFDAFITHYIPWTFWKKSKNKTVLAVMGWVDAIVFALVAVYFINTYVFQNYQIPTPSLEKSLLVGDFLFVSKASYGPRVPNTPLSFPLVQHTLPIVNSKSYIENPQWEYKRLKGFDTIDRNDIVVFNFPTGDSVTVDSQNPDYHISSYYEGYNAIKLENPEATPDRYACYARGKQIIKDKENQYGKLVYRPVDRRENYVKRCVGLAGDWLEVRNNQVYVNGEAQVNIPGLQFNYYVQTDGKILSDQLLTKLNISRDDRQLLDPQSYGNMIAYLGLNPAFPVYHFPLTSETYDKLKNLPGVTQIKIEPAEFGGDVFPLGGGKSWTRDNYGPIYIPKKGDVIKLNTYNLPIYERIIDVYEGNDFAVKGNDIFINGEKATHYNFKMDYYWMMGDNRHNSADSRSWGFVPEDHVVGRPVLVWLSLDKDKSLFEGKIRFNRFFKDASK